MSGPIPVVFWYIDFMTSMELSDRLFRSRLGFQSVFDAWVVVSQCKTPLNWASGTFELYGHYSSALGEMFEKETGSHIFQKRPSSPAD